MAAQLSLDCPHCHTAKAGFVGTTYLASPPGHGQQFIMLFQCGVCGEGIIAKVQAVNSQQLHQWVQGQIVMKSNMGNITLLKHWPEEVTTKSPGHVPENVTSFYSQGLDSLARKNYDAAGTMFRKSLDTALKRLHPSGKGTLQNRIDNLPADVAVTPAMKKWAHEIRELGNDAAHEEDPFTEDEAKILKNFTELFLTYTFTLPGMLAARKPQQP